MLPAPMAQSTRLLSTLLLLIIIAVDTSDPLPSTFFPQQPHPKGCPPPKVSCSYETLFLTSIPQREARLDLSCVHTPSPSPTSSQQALPAAPKPLVCFLRNDCHILLQLSAQSTCLHVPSQAGATTSARHPQAPVLLPPHQLTPSTDTAQAVVGASHPQSGPAPWPPAASNRPTSPSTTCKSACAPVA